MKNLLKNHRGDTIVEVLIAITVLSFIMGASYTLANKSSLAVRQSQERGESFKITETQIEKLKQYASIASVSNDIPTSGSVFCMKTDGGAITVQAFDAGKRPPDDAQQENFISYPAECKNGDFYYTFVSREGNTFTAHTRWEKVNGDGIDEATMVYRIYPDTIAALDNSPLSVGGCQPNQQFNTVGNCDPCPFGQGSPGGREICRDIPPKITVSVQQLLPGPNESTPQCSAGGATNPTFPVSVSINGLGIATSSNAPATFDGLIPRGNYSLQIGSLPQYYEPCPQNPAPVSAGLLASTTNHNFVIRPKCEVPKTRNETVTRTRLVPQYTTIYWWQHTGPGWGPFGPQTPTQGPPKPRYAIGNNKSGFPTEYYATEQSVAGRGTVTVRYALLNTSNPNESNAWYNRFELWSGQQLTGYITETYNETITVPYTGCP